MRFKIDENLPAEAAALLIESGFETDTVLAEHLQGCTDSEVYSKCLNEQRILVTLDQHFANTLEYIPQNGPGIIVLKLGNQNRSHVLQTIRDLAHVLHLENPVGRLWVIDERRVRIWPDEP